VSRKNLDRRLRSNCSRARVSRCLKAALPRLKGLPRGGLTSAKQSLRMTQVQISCGLTGDYLRNLAAFPEPAHDTQRFGPDHRTAGIHGNYGGRCEGSATMPVTRQIGSPAMRSRITEAALVFLVLAAAAIAYWLLR